MASDAPVAKDDTLELPVDQEASSQADADAQPFELSLYLPKRPLLPAGHAAAGLPETPSPLKVAVTPQESLNELRVTITDSPEGYWLGAFCFRRPSSKATQSNGAGKRRLGERVNEWTELQEIFKDVPKEERVLHVAHVQSNDAEARAHIQRLRELLSGGQADPSSIGIDGGISVQDAIKNADLWEEELKTTRSDSANYVNHKGGKKDKQLAATKKEAAEPIRRHEFDDFKTWKSSDMSQLIPEVMRSDRTFPQCLRHMSVSAWNPPPHHLRAQGHFVYLQAITLEGEHLSITASSQGFYINKSTTSRFDPTPRASPDDYSSSSLFDIFCGISPLFLANFAKLFQDPISQRDYFAVVPMSNCLPSHPWLARKYTHTADLLRSQSAFLLTGATSVDTLDGTRDWNDEIQSTRELPKSTLPERLMRDRVLNRVYAEFTLAAARAVPRVAAGEVQAMNPMDKSEAQMFIVNNLFISKGVDGVDIYPHMGGDEAAHVAVSKDVQGIKCLNNLDVEGICLLGTVVIDWMGERWVAQSVVPGLFRRRDDDAEAELEDAKGEEKVQANISEVGGKENETTVEEVVKTDAKDDTQVIYGGVDGPEVIKKDPSFHTLFGKIAKSLHLSLHDVKDAKGEEHALWLSVDSKGLRGADGRKYALDLARLNPVDITWLETHMQGKVMDGEEGQEVQGGGDYPHRMTLLRQELIEIFWDHEFRAWAREELLKKEKERREKEKDNEEDESKKGEASEPERLDATLFKLEFNPDAFVEFKSPEEEVSRVLVDDENDLSVSAVRRASTFLQNTAIPRLVSDVAIGTQTAQDGFALTRQMHSRGINIRYLGAVAHLCHPSQRHRLNSDLLEKAGPGIDGFLTPFKKVVLQEMVLRASKRILRRFLKQVEVLDLGNVISHFLNCLLGGEIQSNPAPIHTVSPFAGEDESLPEWVELTPAKLQSSIQEEIKQRYRYRLPDSFYTQELRKNQLLREVCKRCGLQLKLKNYVLEASSNGAVTIGGGPSSEDSVGESTSTALPATATNKKKKKSAAGNSQAAARQVTAFQPEDVLNLVPVIKDSTPKSVLAEEAFEAGRISISRGDRALGLDLMTEGISFHEQVYGIVHPEVARCYSIYATILHHYASILAVEGAEKQRQAQVNGSTESVPPSELSEQISVANALRYQRQAVTVSERSIGLDSDETLAHYVNLAVLERIEGNIESSMRCQNRILQLLELLYGEDHPDVINALNNIALTLQNSRQFDKSLKVYVQSYDMAVRLYGKDSINTAYLGHELSQAYTLSADLKKAIEVEKQVNRVFESRLGKEDNMTKESSTLLNNLAASAVRLAKMNVQQKEMAKIGIANQLRGNVGRVTAASDAPVTTSAPQASKATTAIPSSAVSTTAPPITNGASPATAADLSNRSLDDLVKFIQGPATPTKSSSSKANKGGMKKLGRK
ncbi:hypothetical protein CBS101457_005230 [Exobasidium rhododendri]|nr:hypothetical protein CBS101457_005230 [Exobasidium rhododendri]